uniref:Ral transcription factor IIIC subunit 5 n=1 Tax=Oncorhynchus kisutch TaxID=8019 RepID=A0A8C7DFE9_ONCKI
MKLTTVGGVPGSSATLSLSEDNRLVCVEYLQCGQYVGNYWGYTRGVQGEQPTHDNQRMRTYADPSRRLELRFRSKDPFCHPVVGNRFQSTNLLLHVQLPKHKHLTPLYHCMIPFHCLPTLICAVVTLHCVFVDICCTLFIVAGMADFQYLVVHSAKDGSHTSLYNKILLRKPENNEFFERPVPLFIPPHIFSRLDSAVDYSYQPEIQHKEGYCPPTVSRNNLIGLSRARRPHNAIFLNFDDKNVPTEPLEAAKFNWKRVCVHPSNIKAKEQINKMFESRPIWSRNSVKANLDIHPDKLKLLLPIVSYYMLRRCPWRSLWVRFGYDPRKTTEAKKHQVLDFRIRCSTKHRYTINDMPVKAKRSTFNYTLPITLNKASVCVCVRLLIKPHILTAVYPVSCLSRSHRTYFEMGPCPPHRQMFYQLCDLDVQSIRNMVFRNDGQEEECDGWCLSHTSDDLRDIMSSMIKQVICAKRPGKTSLCNTDVALLWPTWPGIKPGSWSETSPWGVVI